jgi:hypothetical protein
MATERMKGRDPKSERAADSPSARKAKRTWSGGRERPGESKARGGKLPAGKPRPLREM